MSAIDRVRILVLGDSGVGKTSFVHLAAFNEPIKSPSWTVGCTVEVKLHEYKEGTPDQTTYFIEFWDVGGSNNHRNTRHVFYYPCHGIILVHDLTNRKSEEHLDNWLQEVMNKDPDSGFEVRTSDFDYEGLLGEMQVPVLVVGTKVDLEGKKGGSGFAGRFGVDEVLVDCRQVRYLAPATTNSLKLTRFFDKVIEKKGMSGGSSPFGENFRPNSVSPVLPSKFFLPTHAD